MPFVEPVRERCPEAAISSRVQRDHGAREGDDDHEDLEGVAQRHPLRSPTRASRRALRNSPAPPAAGAPRRSVPLPVSKQASRSTPSGVARRLRASDAAGGECPHRLGEAGVTRLAIRTPLPCGLDHDWACRSSLRSERRSEVAVNQVPLGLECEHGRVVAHPAPQTQRAQTGLDQHRRGTCDAVCESRRRSVPRARRRESARGGAGCPDRTHRPRDPQRTNASSTASGGR